MEDYFSEDDLSKVKIDFEDRITKSIKDINAVHTARKDLLSSLDRFEKIIQRKFYISVTDDDNNKVNISQTTIGDCTEILNTIRQGMQNMLVKLNDSLLKQIKITNE